jgi:hypothetical protein
MGYRTTAAAAGRAIVTPVSIPPEHLTPSVSITCYVLDRAILPAPAANDR